MKWSCHRCLCDHQHRCTKQLMMVSTSRLLINACKHVTNSLHRFHFLWFPHYHMSLLHSSNVVNKRTSKQPMGTRLRTDWRPLDSGIILLKDSCLESIWATGLVYDARHIPIHKLKYQAMTFRKTNVHLRGH